MKNSQNIPEEAHFQSRRMHYNVNPFHSPLKTCKITHIANEKAESWIFVARKPA